MLQDYLNWPYAEQVFRLEREFVRLADGKEMKEVSYGVTSLSREEADADRLLQLSRGHWGIEKKLHYRRDDTLHVDRCRLKGQGAQAMAMLSNLVLDLLRNKGFATVPDVCRYYTANLHEAATLVLRSPG